MEGEVELGDGEDEVLVEEVEDEVGNADVVESAVEEDQVPETLELMDRKVRVLRCPEAFFPHDSNSNVSLQDH